MKKHVYIIGSKGIPAKYGGFETFVEKLTEYQSDENIKYHVACMKENSLKSDIIDDQFSYNGADCFNIDVPNIGPAKAIYYDIKALDYAISLAKKNKDVEPIFYILACRMGPFLKKYKEKIAEINGHLFLNPDGHEFLRAKWSLPVRKYWKMSEQLMVKRADLIVCDSKNIEKYIHEDYEKYQPKTTYIAYGTDLEKTNLMITDNKVREWFSSKKVTEHNYYLIVGRFVPENNLETIIKEFMKSTTTKDLVIISNVEENKFYKQLEKKTKFNNDSRIKFVGTVYDQELLKYIREEAFAYIHGHEVGGTNPSLLEAMASTKLNLLLDVGFNREVGQNSALYWNKEEFNLSKLVNDIDFQIIDDFNKFDEESSKIIKTNFSWINITHRYECIFKEV